MERPEGSAVEKPEGSAGRLEGIAPWFDEEDAIVRNNLRGYPKACWI